MREGCNEMERYEIWDGTPYNEPRVPFYRQMGGGLFNEWQISQGYATNHLLIIQHVFDNNAHRIWQNHQHESCRGLNQLSMATWIMWFGVVFKKLWLKYSSKVKQRLPTTPTVCNTFLTILSTEFDKVIFMKVLDNCLIFPTNLEP